MPLHVDFYFDIVSPYSWLAFEVLYRYAKIWKLEVHLKPAFLGGVMKSSENTPPLLAAVPSKALYISRDIMRCASLFDVPLKQPSDFFSVMRQTMKSMRLLCAVQLADLSVERVSRALWQRVWSRDEDITSEASWREALSAAGIRDGKTQDLLIRMASESEAKELLRSHTEAALKLEAFGFPFFVFYRDEDGSSAENPAVTVFGSDRFELVAHELGLPWYGPVPRRAKI